LPAAFKGSRFQEFWNLGFGTWNLGLVIFTKSPMISLTQFTKQLFRIPCRNRSHIIHSQPA
jgi:hypothetical protein